MLASKDAVLVATSLVLAVSTIVSVTIQLERQLQTVGQLTVSTWFLLFSAFFALVMTTIVCIAASKGLGAAITAEEFNSRVMLQKLLIAAFPPYFLCNQLVKHAWLTFYYGLARTPIQRYFIHFMHFVAAGFGISSILVIVLQCVPLSAAWDQNPATKATAKCINLLAFFYANAIIMIVNDLAMYLLPMVMLWNVEMLAGHRWGVYALFGVGGLVVLASVFRLVAVYGIDTSDNLSAHYALVYLWAAVENHVGICAACGGAIKQKSVAAVEAVKRVSSEMRHKSWLLSSATRSQVSEDRTLYERTDSSASLRMGDSSKGSGLRMELYEVSYGDERKK